MFNLRVNTYVFRVYHQNVEPIAFRLILNLTKLQVQINNKVISQVTNFKYLGIELDTQLNWENHYDTVRNKMNQRVHLINRYKHCLSAKWLQVITYGIVLSVLDYCYPIWGNLSSI